MLRGGYMLFSAIIIICIMAVYIIFNYRNKFTYVMTMYFFSIAVMMVVAVLYISKLSTYKFPLQIDYNLYLLLSKVKIHIRHIARMFNAGIALFMLSSVAFMGAFKKYKWWQIFLFILPVIYFLVINDSTTSWNLYLWLNTASDAKTIDNLNLFLNISKLLNEIMIVLYIIIPFYSLCIYFMRTKIRIKKKYALVFGICLFLIDCFVYFVFIGGPFSGVMFNNVDLVKFPVSSIQYEGYILVPVVVMLVLLLVISLTLYYKPFNSLVLISKKEMVQNTKLLNKNLRMVLHTYKNAFLGVEKLSDLIEKNLVDENYPKALEYAQIVNGLAVDQRYIIEKTLAMLKDIKVSYTNVNLTECMDNALDKACLPSDIKVCKNYEADDIVVRGDEFHLSEVFVNMFVNAADALKKKNGDEPAICIAVMLEDELSIIEISDNGCGIEKKELKNIFKPFYSTKPRIKSGGVGLKYVESVVRQYHGDITVKSEFGKYTTFQIVLPVYKKRGGRIWRK